MQTLAAERHGLDSFPIPDCSSHFYYHLSFRNDEEKGLPLEGQNGYEESTEYTHLYYCGPGSITILSYNLPVDSIPSLPTQYLCDSRYFSHNCRYYN